MVWGTCGHAFHLQCITKWLSAQAEQVMWQLLPQWFCLLLNACALQRCPFCRRNWEFKAATTQRDPPVPPGVG